MAARRAFQIASLTGHTVCFTFDPASARVFGSAVLGCAYADVDCKRAAHFDCFASVGYVPADVLLQYGWLMRCANCGHDVAAGDDVESRGRHAYCNVFCQESHEAYLDEIVQERMIARAVFDSRYPGATVTEIRHCGEHGHPVVSFTFPGGTRPVSVEAKYFRQFICNENDRPALTRWLAQNGHTSRQRR